MPGRCLGFKDGIEKFDELLLAGEPTLEPRLAPVPVRLPLPPAVHQGSIYENQRASGRRYFTTAAECGESPTVHVSGEGRIGSGGAETTTYCFDGLTRRRGR